jgi:hypothetical protein
MQVISKILILLAVISFTIQTVQYCKDVKCSRLDNSECPKYYGCKIDYSTPKGCWEPIQVLCTVDHEKFNLCCDRVNGTACGKVDRYGQTVCPFIQPDNLCPKEESFFLQ